MHRHPTLFAALFLFLFLFLTLSGCAGARGTIDFAGLRYPVSMSPALYGTDDRILTAGKELEVVEDFSYDKGFWSTLYGAVSLSGGGAVSAAMNEAIEASGGQGIVNLAVTSSESTMNAISYLFWLYLLPVTPGCVNVTVKGQIVKLKR